MSQSSGNSPIDRVVAWFKGMFGSGQSDVNARPTTPPPATDSAATARSTTEPVATTLSATETAATQAPASTTQQVDRANDAMRESARDLVRPLEDEAEAASSAATTAASDASDAASSATATAATEASDTVSAARTASASTQARVDDINNELREKARNLVRPLDSESDADLSGTSDLPGDAGEATTAAATGQPTGASSDEFAAGGYTPDPVTATDVERAAETAGSPSDGAVAAPGPGPTPVEEARIDTVSEGTYAATAGDIATDGPSSGDDLGLVDDGDLDATERGALENAEDAQLTHLPGSDRPVFGTRTGADFSMTGFHAGMRGDEADAFVAGNADAPTEYESTTGGGETDTGSAASTDASSTWSSDTQAASESTGDLAASVDAADSGNVLDADRATGSGDASTFSPSEALADVDTSISDASSLTVTSDAPAWDSTSASSESSTIGTNGTATDGASSGSSGADRDDAPAAATPGGAGQGADLSRTGLQPGSSDDDGPGNTAMTAGDDYSAGRAAEELPGVARVSTTAADTGVEMASGLEVDDLVGGEPVSEPPAGVAVAAEPTDEVSTGSGSKYAGAVQGDGTANTPAGYPVKGNGSSMIYHTPDMPSYQATKPEWCFATPEDAERAGFRAPRRYQKDGDS